uniref:Uncharacterized protein n=1 Tax=Neoizziella asiatica TaxID=1077397 RepID=A0A1G4NWQ0_9FLOR|nr:Hypothetical protein ORF_7 [Neoizziella asiatica]SCW23133.1 Hypothetical protein ORF_7 [Neoizziella asiatica]
MNIKADFIKLWDYQINITSRSKIRHDKSIPKIIRILTTNNGSLTRNSSILHSQFINILLVKQYKELHNHSTHIKKQSQVQLSTRQVWLVHNYNKKKFFLQSQI